MGSPFVQEKGKWFDIEYMTLPLTVPVLAPGFMPRFVPITVPLVIPIIVPVGLRSVASPTASDDAKPTEKGPVPAVEAKPAVAEAKPAVAEAKPAVAEAKPAVAEAKPAVAEAKPAVAEAKPATKPVEERKETISSTPAPAPVSAPSFAVTSTSAPSPEPAPAPSPEPAPEPELGPAPEPEPAPDEADQESQPEAAPAHTPPNPADAPNFPVKIMNIDKVGEIVQLQNISSEPVNLTGWRVISVTGNQNHPGIDETIWPNETKFFANHGRKIWSDTQRDDGALYDQHGNLISYWNDVPK